MAKSPGFLRPAAAEALNGTAPDARGHRPAAGAPGQIRAVVLIGVDLGPNLSATGSLATILWLAALRRDGFEVGAWRFLKLGVLVMPPALILALAGVSVID